MKDARGAEGVTGRQGDTGGIALAPAPFAPFAPSPILVTAEKAREYLGKQRYFAELSERIDRPGIVTGAGVDAGGRRYYFH